MLSEKRVNGNSRFHEFNLNSLRCDPLHLEAAFIWNEWDDFQHVGFALEIAYVHGRAQVAAVDLDLFVARQRNIHIWRRNAKFPGVRGGFADGDGVCQKVAGICRPGSRSFGKKT